MNGVLVLLFYYHSETTMVKDLGFVSAHGGSWDFAAARAVLEINELNLQRGLLAEQKLGETDDDRGIVDNSGRRISAF